MLNQMSDEKLIEKVNTLEEAERRVYLELKKRKIPLIRKNGKVIILNPDSKLWLKKYCAML